MIYSYLLHRLNPALNERRFYQVTIQRTLFDDVAVIRTWGRIGGAQRSKIDWCAGEIEAQRLAGRLVARKLKRGYQIIQPKEEQ